MSILKLFVIVALLLLSIALGLGSFFTNAWIKYTVTANATDPDYKANAGSSYLYHTRERGLFWNKLDLTTATMPVINANDGSPYFTIAYNVKKQCSKPSEEFQTITTMMKSSAYLHIAYLGCLVLGGWMVAMSAVLNNCRPSMVIAFLLLLLGELAGIASIVLFHLYTLAEDTTEVKELDGLTRKSWTKFLVNATTSSRSYSYGSQMASLGITLASIIISVVFLAKWPKNEKKGTNKQQDPRWLGSEQGTVIYGGSLNYRQGDVKRNEQDPGQQHGHRRHSWSGYWEDSGDKMQNGRFRSPPAGYSTSVPALDRDPQYPRHANMANNKQFYTNNPLYPTRY